MRLKKHTIPRIQRKRLRLIRARKSTPSAADLVGVNVAVGLAAAWIVGAAVGEGRGAELADVLPAGAFRATVDGDDGVDPWGFGEYE